MKGANTWGAMEKRASEQAESWDSSQLSSQTDAVTVLMFKQPPE